MYEARNSFDPALGRSAELLQAQLDRFESLLADLLEVSRFDAGAAVLDCEAVEIREIVERVIEDLTPLAHKHATGVQLRWGPGSTIVEADPRRVERIVRNLVGNAIEHSESEPVEVQLAGDAAAVALTVRDHGVGLREADLGMVFNRFWRADPARARTIGGTGLGLSIALEDAHLHGGWLQVWGSRTRARTSGSHCRGGSVTRSRAPRCPWSRPMPPPAARAPSRQPSPATAPRSSPPSPTSPRPRATAGRPRARWSCRHEPPVPARTCPRRRGRRGAARRRLLRVPRPRAGGGRAQGGLSGQRAAELRGATRPGRLPDGDRRGFPARGRGRPRGPQGGPGVPRLAADGVAAGRDGRRPGRGAAGHPGPAAGRCRPPRVAGLSRPLSRPRGRRRRAGGRSGRRPRRPTRPHDAADGAPYRRAGPLVRRRVPRRRRRATANGVSTGSRPVPGWCSPTSSS